MPGAWLKSTLTALLGATWVENPDTPKLYERPWWGYGWISVVAGAACLLFGLAQIRHHRYASAT